MREQLASSVRKAWLLPLGIAVTALAAASWIALREAPEAEPTRSPTAQRSSEPSVAKPQLQKSARDVGSLSPAEQLRLAFAAVFGSAESATRTIDGETLTYTPAALEWIGDKAALLSFGKNAKDCHACFGAIGIHYLKPVGHRFEISGAWPRAIDGVAWGEATGGLSVDRSFSSYPVVASRYGDMNQGCAFGGVILTEIRPEGPILLAEIVTTHVNPVGDDQAISIKGTISNIKKDQSFKVVYKGSDSFTETYVRRGNKFVSTIKESRMPWC